LSKVVAVSIVESLPPIQVILSECLIVRLSVRFILALTIALVDWEKTLIAEVSSTSAFDMGATEHLAYSCTAFWAPFDFPFLKLCFEERVKIAFRTFTIVDEGAALRANRCRADWT